MPMTVTVTQIPYKKKPYPPVVREMIPPLENGDVLTRKEFERRYNAMPHVKKAELIEGRVYMPAAVRKDHGSAHSDMIAWLVNYRVATPNVRVYDNTTYRMDETNEPQPDAAIRIESDTLRHAWKNEGKYLENPPELVVEVSGSSASHDLHGKLLAYQRNGIQEYVVWQIYDNRLDWFQLVDGKYEPIPQDEDDILRSRVFPGLWLASDALLAGDMAEVLDVLQQGIQTEEHAAFVEHLQ